MTLNWANHVVQNTTMTPGMLSTPAYLTQDLVAENKLQLNEDKSNAWKFKAQNFTCTLSIGQATICFYHSETLFFV